METPPAQSLAPRAGQPALAPWLQIAALLLICVVTFVPGLFTIPAVDRDESRFAQASRQMLESGDVVVPMVQGTPRLNKPPLIYWAQSFAAYSLTGGDGAKDAIWMYRLPSLFAAAGTVLLLWRMGRSMVGDLGAFVGAAAFAASPVIFWEARQARADMVLVFFTMWAMTHLWELLRSPQRPAFSHVVWLWVAVGLGVLTKGPITPMVVATTCLMFGGISGRWDLVRRIRPLVGTAIVLAIGLPWLIAVVTRIGPQAYWNTIFAETLGRSVQAKEGHWGPPGYHLLLSPVLLYPVSLGIGAALAGMVRAIGDARIARKHQTLEPEPPAAELFLTSWVVPSWIVFELVSTKLPHYTMPLLPAAALLCMHGLTSQRAWAVRLRDASWVRVALVAFTLITMALSVVLWMAGITTLDQSVYGGLPTYSLVGLVCALTIGCVLMMFRMLRSQRPVHMLAAATVLFGVGGAVLSLRAAYVPQLWTSRQIVAVLKKADPQMDRPIAAVGYEEDSLIFETHGVAQRVPVTELDAWMDRNSNGLICITEEQFKQFPSLKSLGAVQGFNYSKGKWVNVVIAQHEEP